MRNLLFLVFIAINSGIHTSAQTRTLTVVVDNLSNLPQTDVPVAVALPHDIRVRSANLVPSQNGNGISSLPYQLDDLDDDGLNDELFFLTDLEGNEKRSFALTLSEQ